MKQCTKCGEQKPPEQFNLCKGKLRAYCKDCHTAESAKWAQANRDKVRERAARYRAKNAKPPRQIIGRAESRRKWAEANLERLRQMRREWNAANKHRVLAATRKYQSQKLKASPKWANAFFIEEIYDLSARRTQATGVPWEVDHIIPLQSHAVCGLHVEGNLRVVPRTQNRIKGNSHAI